MCCQVKYEGAYKEIMDLAHRVEANERPALERLGDLLLSTAERIGKWLGVRDIDLDDFAQDVAIKLLQYLPGKDFSNDIHALRGYIFTVCRHMHAEIIRRRKKKRSSLSVMIARLSHSLTTKSSA